jgi:hypothetical protein
MPAIPVPRPYICAGCLRAQRRPNVFAPVRAIANGSVRRYAQATTQPRGEEVGRHEHEVSEKGQGATNGGEEKEEGAFTRRMREMSEEVLESGGHSALKAVDEAGFNADLKAELEQRIAGVNLRSTADLPDFASRHTRDLATTEAWTGTESLHDASLRMLNDAHKPLRLGRPPKMPGVPVPQSIDTGHKRVKDGGRGLRLANARDRSTVYSTLKEDEDLEDTEREKRFQELKDRFDPNARAVVPGTIQGLANLANKRIEDAIARGQFKNIKRGKTANVERDYNASSPFIDTTEYFMNKIIQKQEIVPPWIEKQQELTSAANKFRTRLRADWKRHAARMIASKGGSLIDQVKRAEAYAKAELDSNPLKKNQESFTTVDDRGHMSQISLSSELKVTPPAEESNAEPVVTEEIVAERVTLDGSPGAVAQTPAMATVEDSATQTIEVPVHTHEATVAPAPGKHSQCNMRSSFANLS